MAAEWPHVVQVAGRLRERGSITGAELAALMTPPGATVQTRAAPKRSIASVALYTKDRNGCITGEVWKLVENGTTRYQAYRIDTDGAKHQVGGLYLTQEAAARLLAQKAA